MRISEIDYAGWGPDSSQECNQSERKSLLSLHSSESLYTESFDDVDGNRYGNLDSYTPPILALANKEDSYGIKPSNYSCFGTKEAYLKDFLLNRINSKEYRRYYYGLWQLYLSFSVFTVLAKLIAHLVRRRLQRHLKK